MQGETSFEIMTTNTPRTSPRNEYLLQESRRVEASRTLAAEFPALASMTVDLGFYDSEGISCRSQIKYKVNLQQARSVLRFGCENPECIGGGFDLSGAVAEAVTNRETTVSGEMSCHGWRSHTTINRVQCGKRLRFSITLTY